MCLWHLPRLTRDLFRNGIQPLLVEKEAAYHEALAVEANQVQIILQYVRDGRPIPNKMRLSLIRSEFKVTQTKEDVAYLRASHKAGKAL